MTNFTAARTGAIGADALAIWQKLFPGEVLTAFERATVMKDKHIVRTIQNGKSAAFPAHGRLTASLHTPGTTLTGQSITNGEKLLSVDGLLVADAFTADIDDAMAHYDVRSVLAAELGNALAREFDLNVIRTLLLSASIGEANPGGYVGATSAVANMLTDSAVLAASIFAANQVLDEKDVSDADDRFTLVKPAQYYLLAQNTTVLNKDWNGAGSYSDGKVTRIAGAIITKTNNLRTTDESADATVQPKYRGNWTNTAAVTFNRRAVGTVQLIGMAMESEYQIRQQGTLMVAKQSVGHGILRPDCVYWHKTT